MKQPITVPFKIVPDMLPLSCLLNCEKQVEREVGRCVFGWSVVDYYYYYGQVHHVVWEDAAGQMWELTPVIVGCQDDNITCQSGLPIQFIPDPKALFLGESPNRRALPSRFIAKHDDPSLKRAMEYLDRSDAAQVNADRAKCRYWNDRAETMVNQFAKRKRKPLIELSLPPLPDQSRIGCESALAV